MRRAKRKNFYNISMINLIDIIFILLIFFMITTTFKQTESFGVNLPKSNSSFSRDNNISVSIFYDLNEKITIKADKNIVFSSNLDELSQKIKGLNLNSYKTVHLSADSALGYGKIINLISILKDNEIANLNLDIEKY
ncbi:biopolymer transporter ExbD [Campylobacter ureolyticus]|uniref:biopolymer transporter ExbD n=1 Tax=Campylobacter ureolyticus TaxID=827 RepID=UPI00215A4D71|nr:biopolymer transporter ExbD [Campylobacter ureolyticus]MCR8699800.1 biopolymer transporter ExbD [Campylobacter ureolyticus]